MMDRRTALQAMGAFTAAVATGDVLSAQTQASPSGSQSPPPTPHFTLPALPYGYDSLEPNIDEQTMRLHHDKHHAAYVNNLNTIFAAHPEFAVKWTGKSADDLIAHLDQAPESIRQLVRNNGGGHANHSFLWLTLGKSSSDSPSGDLLADINRRFTTFAQFQEKLTAAALSVFGSGWAWLTRSPDGSLNIEVTANQDSPLMSGRRPVLGVDVWEHAYYLKYQNRRAEYVKAFYNAVNWDAVSAKYTAMTAKS